MSALGPIQQDVRGWPFIEFPDRYGTIIRLKVSSLADYDQPGVSALWLGPIDPDPKIMAKDAAVCLVETNETTGWIPYPLPPQVQMSTMAHLSRENVEALIGHLSAWLETGSLEVEG